MICFRCGDGSKVQTFFKCASISTNYFLNKFILNHKTLKTNALTPKIILPKKYFKKCLRN